MTKIYGRTSAFNVQKVLWFLEELDLDYTHIQVGGDFGGLDTKEFLTMNINGTIPVLDDNGSFIWESHTILRYLASKYSPDNWISSDPYKNSLYERWMDWGQTSFQPIFMKLFWGFYRTPEDRRDSNLINESLIQMNTLLSRLDIVLQDSKYIAGENISLGDICVGACIYRLINIGLTIKLPSNIGGWYSRLQERTGYRKWIMSDFSTLKGKLSY